MTEQTTREPRRPHKTRAGVLLFIVLSILASALAGTIAAHAEEAVSERCAAYYYGTGCPHCAQALSTIEELERQGITILKYDIYADKGRASELDAIFETRAIPTGSRGVPTLVTATGVLIGADQIADRSAEATQNAGPCAGLPTLETLRAGTGQDAYDPDARTGRITLIGLIGAAFVDSINPCAIAVLLILLTALLAAGDKKRALLAGLAFTLAVYLTYLLMGVGLFSALHLGSFGPWFTIAIGVLAVVIGVLNIKDFFWYGGGGFVIEIPRSWRPAIKQILGQATSPGGAFLAGIVVCLFELPCTGGAYLFVLGLLSSTATYAQAIPLLLLYNLVFVLPLLVITFVIHAGLSSVESATAWKDKNLRVLHLVAGLVMLGLGVLVLTTF